VEDITQIRIPKSKIDFDLTFSNFHYFGVDQEVERMASTMASMSQYTTCRKLGEGAYGKALLVRRKSDQKQCVIKEVNVMKVRHFSTLLSLSLSSLWPFPFDIDRRWV
jgi:serine/threonine protein kinase